jgi:hypothetical protein
MRDFKSGPQIVILLLACTAALFTAAAAAPPSTSAPASGQKPRARDLGVPFDGTPGPLNAITDVA